MVECYGCGKEGCFVCYRCLLISDSMFPNTEDWEKVGKLNKESEGLNDKDFKQENLKRGQTELSRWFG